MQERFLYVLNRCIQGGAFLICTTAFHCRPPTSDLDKQITVRGVSLLHEVCRVVRMPGNDYRGNVINPGLDV